MITPLIGMPMGAEWLVILAIVVLVFGAAKLPDLARGTGQALRIFKAETKGLKNDDEDGKDTSASVTLPESGTSATSTGTTSATPVNPVTPGAPITPEPIVTEETRADKNHG